MNRFRYPSIVTVPEDALRIVDALRRLPAGIPPSTHFGKGTSASLFMDLLRSEVLWKVTRQKQFRDLSPASASGAETMFLQTEASKA
jgi:hypothetical protein